MDIAYCCSIPDLEVPQQADEPAPMAVDAVPISFSLLQY